MAALHAYEPSAVPDMLEHLQGRKSPGRLDTMALLQLGIEQVLALLGLGADSPADVLVELRERALVR